MKYDDIMELALTKRKQSYELECMPWADNVFNPRGIAMFLIISILITAAVLI